jgi:cyclophilin family peptidyl-prolyl cis-trans isomerase
MFKQRIFPVILATGAFLLGGLYRSSAQDGIYADFQTSMGNFTCRLDYAVAPKAVANFIGLATGQRAWMNLTNGVAQTNAFFNGITFHRVIADFMIQAGSPNGLGTDGPGYAFVDEFKDSARFNTFGVLAMANSGPDSNGSQLFITVAPTPKLNDVHTIFGRVVGGSNVVYGISRVVTDAHDKPKTNVVIQGVSIRRVGSAAQAFRIDDKGLPVVTNQPLAIAAASGGRWVLRWSTNRQYADNRLYVSTNLSSWQGQELGIELSTQVTNSVYQSNELTAAYYRLAQIQYAGSTLAPKTLNGRLLTLDLQHLTQGIGTLKITFDASGQGSYTSSGLIGNYSGSVTEYAWTQQPYRAYLWPIYFASNLPPMTMELDFTSATRGKLRGSTAYYLPTLDISGSAFTVGP